MQPADHNNTGTNPGGIEWLQQILRDGMLHSLQEKTSSMVIVPLHEETRKIALHWPAAATDDQFDRQWGSIVSPVSREGNFSERRGYKKNEVRHDRNAGTHHQLLIQKGG